MTEPEYIAIIPVMKAKPDGATPVGYINDLYCRGDVTAVEPELPDGLIFPRGQTLSWDDYPELYAVIGDGNPKWHQIKQRWRRWRLRHRRQFRVPDFRGRVAIAVDPCKE